MIKCLAGFHRPDEIDAIEINGKATSIDVAGAGSQIAFVHQDLGLMNDLTVLENFVLTDRHALAGVTISWQQLRESVAASLSHFGLKLSLDARISSLSQADRCLIAIVRAVRSFEGATSGRVLILDEPTPFLPASGVEKLFALMRQFTQAGGSIIFVAHDIDEVREITDRIVVLRDGKRVADFDTSVTSRDEIIEAIIGRALQHHLSSRGDAKRVHDDTPWRITGLSGGGVQECDFTVAPGEILGVTGLVGSGASHVPELLTGARQSRTGHLCGQGKNSQVDLATTTLNELMAREIFLLPDDRLGKSGIGELTLAENIALPALLVFTKAMCVMRDPLKRHVTRVVADAGVTPSDPVMLLGSFSGGNQQKAMIAKWLALSPRILALSEPTQGVDIGSRQSIYAAIEDAAKKGAAIVCYSSDAGELAQICDRVLIFFGGRIVAELEGDALGKDSIVSASLGQVKSAQIEIAKDML